MAPRGDRPLPGISDTKARHRPRQAMGGVVALLFLGLLTTACGKPGYFIDIFAEMHYQQWYRSQEPPRLYPPADSVPIGGREVAYGFPEAGALANPLPLSQQNQERAARLYQINCGFCHGPRGRGDGPLAHYFQEAGATAPVDFASPRVASRSPGQLFWLVTNGVGFMPPFGRLLSEEERWLLVDYVQSLAAP